VGYEKVDVLTQGEWIATPIVWYTTKRLFYVL
jgi:hypothetical protein